MKEWNGDGTLPVLYSKTATGAINYWQCWVEGPCVCVRWGQVEGAAQEARFVCKPKNEGKANATTAHEQAVKEAKAKWRKQLKKKYSESIETAGETERFKPMLALDFEEHKHKLVYPVTLQPKFDGVRCISYFKDGRVILQSRGGDPYSVDHVSKALTGMLVNGAIFDGELYVHGLSLQSLNSLVRRPQEESLQITYCVYDVISRKSPDWNWTSRWHWLTELGGLRFAPPVYLSPSLVALNEAQVISAQKHFIEHGYEGAIVRTGDGTYREGYRSPHLLKVKSWKDDEFEIINWTVGKGKFESVPIFKCKTKEGKEFDVAPKGTNAERLEMLNNAPSLIGRLMKVKYFDYTDEGVPHYPVGLGIRDQSDLST